MNYAKAISTQPQTQPIIGRNDMVQNNAGGYVFKINDLEQLERFLLLGSEGGTYYVSQNKLTIDNTKTIIKFIKTNGKQVVDTVTDFAVNRKAPKADAGLFVLALTCTYGDHDTKQLAYKAISKVCSTSTQLFTFVDAINQLRGWSKGLCKGVANWYLSRSSDTVAYQMVKYRQRNGYTHKDVLRLAHPKATDAKMNELFAYAVGKKDGLSIDNELIQNFEFANNPDATVDGLIKLINESGMSWEMIPTDKLNNEQILRELLKYMPLTALVRNLNRFAYNGMTVGNNDVVKQISQKLRDKEYVTKSKIHPINVISSLRTYSKGMGDKGNKTWSPNQNVNEALADLYELSLPNIKPTNKNILIGADISGSMSSPVSGMNMSASEVAQVLAVTMLKTEPNAELINFDTQVSVPRFNRKSSIQEVLRYNPNGGGTDCSLPLKYALENKLKLDTIIILTDNETWAGNVHGKQALDKYRKTINPAVKVVEIALVSNPYTQFPQDDKNILRVVGFDSTVIDLINKFIGE